MNQSREAHHSARPHHSPEGDPTRRCINARSGGSGCHRLINPNAPVLLDSLLPAAMEPEEGFEPSTFRLREGCSASTQKAPDGSSLLTLDDPSVQTAPYEYRPIVWMIKRMIKRMIKAHPTEIRMPR